MTTTAIAVHSRFGFPIDTLPPDVSQRDLDVIEERLSRSARQVGAGRIAEFSDLPREINTG